MALALVLALVPSGAARAGTTFTFHGSGWGHGIGMSQWGAYGLALRGWTAGQIIRHYYQGSRLATQGPPIKRFRIGLLQRRGTVNLTAARGSFTLALSSGRVIQTVGEGKSRKVVIRDGRYRIYKPNGKLVGGRAWGSSTNHLQVIRGSGGVVRVHEWGHRVGRGTLEFAIVGSTAAHLVAILAVQAYLFGIAEVPSSWPAAILRAQAIAARTYAFRIVRNLLSSSTAMAGKMAACACHLYGSPADQHYTGWDKETEPGYGGYWVAAVKDTRGRVATYSDSLITTYYSAASGGHTENVETVWGGSGVPYLRGVCDPAEWGVAAASDRGWLERWSVSFSASQLTNRLRSLTGNIGTVTGFRDWVRGVSGRVRTVTVVGTDGARTGVRGWAIRQALGLRDSRFWVNADLNVRGAIRAKYDEVLCRPGVPTRAQRSVLGGAGRLQVFERGRIYRNVEQGVVVWLRPGPVLDAYLAEGAHGGALGLPRSLSRTGDGGWEGVFDGGTITCPPGGGDCTVSTG